MIRSLGDTIYRLEDVLPTGGGLLLKVWTSPNGKIPGEEHTLTITKGAAAQIVEELDARLADADRAHELQQRSRRLERRLPPETIYALIDDYRTTHPDGTDVQMRSTIAAKCMLLPNVRSERVGIVLAHVDAVITTAISTHS